MSILKYFLTIIILILGISLINAQTESTTAYSKFPLKIAIGNHAVGFPFQNSFSAANPFAALGTELAFRRKTSRHLFVSTNLGFIKNEVIGNTVYFDFDLGHRYTHRKGLYFDVALGLGLLNQFHPRNIYKQRSTDASYELVSDSGMLASLVGFKTGLGYDLSKISGLPISIGISHHFFIQTIYFDLMNFPIMPQSTSSILITYKFKKS